MFADTGGPAYQAVIADIRRRRKGQGVLDPAG